MKYIEVETHDNFDDGEDTIFDALDQGATIGCAWNRSREDILKVLGYFVALEDDFNPEAFAYACQQARELTKTLV